MVVSIICSSIYWYCVSAVWMCCAEMNWSNLNDGAAGKMALAQPIGIRSWIGWRRSRPSPPSTGLTVLAGSSPVARRRWCWAGRVWQRRRLWWRWRGCWRAAGQHWLSWTSGDSRGCSWRALRLLIPCRLTAVRPRRRSVTIQQFT